MTTWRAEQICAHRGASAQYPENTVGMKVLTEESYKRGIEVKAKHYKALSKYSDTYLPLLEKNARLREFGLNKNDIDNLNHLNNHPLWWENIK